MANDQHALDTAGYSCCPKKESKETKRLRRKREIQIEKRRGREFEASLGYSKVMFPT